MTWNATAQAIFLNRQDFVFHWLFWAVARNRDTGAPETIGLWSGDDHETLSPEGASRLYYGAQPGFALAPVTYISGTDIAAQSLNINALTPEVEQLLRGYDPRLAACEIHLAVFNATDMTLAATNRQFRGYIERAPIQTGAVGGDAVATIEMVSATRAGTALAGALKSDQRQARRAGDRFRRYGNLSGTSPAWWGASPGV